MSQVQTLNVEAFKDSVFFSLSVKKPGNRKKVRDLAALEAYLKELHKPDEDGAATATQDPAVAVPQGFSAGKSNGTVKITKRLLMRKPKTATDQEDDPFEATCSFLNEAKQKLVGDFGKALPSKIKEGLFVVRKTLVQEFEDRLKATVKELHEVWIPKVKADYEPGKLRSKNTPIKQGGLGPLYREADYMTEADFLKCFGLEWQWLALGVPDDLPAALRAEAKEKMQNQLAEAAEEVKQALRESFQTLIAHATEKLTVNPGEKNKVFRDSLIENIHAFIESFNDKNIMNDQKLAGLVDQARIVLMGANGDGVSPDKLRKNLNTREQTRAQFAEIQKQLDAMIETETGRKFDLED